MMTKYFSVLFLALLGIQIALPLQAQTMYRCGTAYQDRPCENGQKGKIIGVNRASDTSNRPVLDPSCARRGDEVKKIIWSREGGASAEKLLAETHSAERKRLIADVYAIRGNSADVRMAIESDCMAERANARQDGYLPRDEMPVSSRNMERKTSASGDDERSEDNAASGSAALRKRAQCDVINAQLANNRSSQRHGGNSGVMDSLNQQRLALESALRPINCDSSQGAVQMQ